MSLSQADLVRRSNEWAESAGLNNISSSALLSGITIASKAGSGLVRDAFVKGVLDQVLQERVRKSMKWMIHPQFTPRFSHHLSNASDFDLENLDPPTQRPDGVRIPRRMFNIDTGNLEEWPSGQYCILSHSWKGSEIVFPFLQQIKAGLKEKERYEDLVRTSPDESTRKIAAFQAAMYAHLDSEYSDVQLLRIQCLKDLDDQCKKIARLIDESSISNSDSSPIVTDFEQARASYTASIEAHRGVVRPQLIQYLDGEANKEPGQQAPVRAAIRSLLNLLERLRSMQKIEQSLAETKRIIDSGLFNPRAPKVYLWNDTICINKQDANELNESLALMGEWYGNAEFCLVHIDTPNFEWVETLDNLDRPRVHRNYSCFQELRESDGINKPRPKWSTRGWTLQELVLPKMAFFVNSLWEPLERSAVALGPYYYIIGFLDQQIRYDAKRHGHVVEALKNIETLKSIVSNSGDKIAYVEDPQSQSDPWADEVRRLIGLLEFLRIQFPRSLNEDTAASIAHNTIQECALEVSKHPEVFQNKLGPVSGSLDFGDPSKVRSLIESVILTLASKSKRVIDIDKDQMSTFSAVPREECCRGWRRAKYPAQEILSLAAFRECTVATDRVYSLMGLLDVQFPVFHAEGMTRALTRLLDEVVISNNDVSVFNWAGKDLGNPLRGRSLYPATLAAYDPNKDETVSVERRSRLMLMKQFKAKKFALLSALDKLIALLRGFVQIIRLQQHHDELPLQSVRNMIDVLGNKALSSIEKPLLVTLAKLLKIFNGANHQPEFKAIEDHPEDASKAEEMPIQQRVVVPKSDSPAASAEDTSKRVGRFGFKAPKVPSMSMEMPTTLKTGMALLGGGKPQVGQVPAEKPRSQPAHTPRRGSDAEKVMDWLSVTATLDAGENQEVCEILKGTVEEHHEIRKAQERSQGNKRHTPVEDAISPNPITFTTSGVESIFDVQRVIIEMKNPSGLRHRVQNAADVNQKITGRCRISTAIASLEVSFCCTAKQLKRQLDVCDAVRLDIRGDERLQESASIQRENSSLGGMANDLHSKASSDGELVNRMLNFVEETDLNLIAGEWILAKFSGAPAAKWFLCLFELGFGATFYGRRIATDEIDFSTVKPEDSLMEPWEKYMEAKKTELCRIVGRHLEGKQWQRRIEQYGNREGGAEEDESDHDADSILEKGAEYLSTAAATLYGMWADRLDAALDDAALSKTPKRLRTAIANLNKSGDLLPAAFVSDVRIHMF